jgi:hypothetical protein
MASCCCTIAVTSQFLAWQVSTYFVIQETESVAAQAPANIFSEEYRDHKTLLVGIVHTFSFTTVLDKENKSLATYLSYQTSYTIKALNISFYLSVLRLKSCTLLLYSLCRN